MSVGCYDVGQPFLEKGWGDFAVELKCMLLASRLPNLLIKMFFIYSL